MAERPVAGPGLTLGTAGHIDHGKTQLVAALTGVDTDRLEEERRRGISIELGFAELTLPDGTSVGVVDVPGHERLVRSMVAGAGGIDFFLLVVAADDGVMPQTIEHLKVLTALGVERGVIVLSKIDLVDERMRTLAGEEVRELLPGTPVVEASCQTGEGLGRLRQVIATLAAELQGAGDGPSRLRPTADGLLHVDRSFTIAGAGTVVTGTVAEGTISVGEQVSILPGDRTARVRSIQVHGRDVAAAGRGRRAALNLAGVGREQAPRGSVISTRADWPRASFRLDVRLMGELETADRLPRRLQVHHGTRDVAASLVPLGEGLAQLRLEAPLMACAGDRVVLRSIAPPGTLGGAEVLDPRPRRHGRGPRSERLRLLEEGTPAQILADVVADAPSGLSSEPADWRTEPLIAYALARHPPAAWLEALAELQRLGTIRIKNGLILPPTASDADQEPVQPSPERDRQAERLLGLIRADGTEPRAPQTLADELGMSRATVVALLDGLVAAGRLVRVGRDIYYEPQRLRLIVELAGELARRQGSISLGELRDALHTSRKYSQAILEHLDQAGVTVRHGDRHVARRATA